VHDLTQERIRQLIEGAAGVARQIDLSSLLDSTVDLAMELTGAEYGALGVLGKGDVVVDFIHAGIDDETADRIPHLPRGEGVLGVITREAKTVRIDDISRHPDSAGFPEGHPPMTTFLGAPVRVGERVFGNLYLTNKDGGFTQQDEVLVELLAVAAGTAISTLHMQEQLRSLALQADRERIALDLHDSIIQDLFAVGLSLQASSAQVATDPEGVHTRLGEAVDRLDSTIQALRRYIFDLNPPVWVRPSLEASIEELVDSLAGGHGKDVELEIAGDLVGIPDQIFEHLEAVLKEALSNALRHSGGRVSVNVTRDHSQVQLTVADDGRGFEGEDDHDGMGLRNIRHRVAAAGGELTIDSEPGVGSRIHATFPF
jgi:signal transduction histidine kinase